MAHAVVHQVKQGPPQQGRVPLQRKGFGLRRHLHRQGVPLLQPAVEHVGRHLPHQGGGVEAPPPQGLHGVVQAHGQVEVIDQIPDGLALAADDGGLGPPPGREDRVRLQLPGVAHDHGQRGADVMGDAVDPVGAGKVPLLLFPPELAAQHQGGEAQHPQQGQQKQPREPERDGLQHIHIQDEGVLPGAPLRAARHQQTVLPYPYLYRVVAQIPAGKGGHIGKGVAVGHIGGFALLPHHGAALVHQHGPQLLLRQVLPAGKGIAPLRPHQGGGELVHGGVPRAARPGRGDNKGQQPRHRQNQHQHRRGRHQAGRHQGTAEIAPPHGRSSWARR